MFALVGAIGAVAAPIAGRMADAGHTEKMSKFAMVLAVISFVPGFFNLPHGVIFMALTGVLLDFAVQMNMVLGQRAVYTIDPHSRGRLNALYMTSIFIGEGGYTNRLPSNSVIFATSVLCLKACLEHQLNTINCLRQGVINI